MKKNILLCLSVLFLYSCSNSSKSPGPAPAPGTDNLITMNAMIMLENDTLTKIVTQDASYHQLVALNIYMSDHISNGAGDSTRCSLSGLPATAVVSPATATLSLPATWTTFLYMNADTGIYHVSLNITNAKATRIIPFIVHVVP